MVNSRPPTLTFAPCGNPLNVPDTAFAPESWISTTFPPAGTCGTDVTTSVPPSRTAPLTWTGASVPGANDSVLPTD